MLLVVCSGSRGTESACTAAVHVMLTCMPACFISTFPILKVCACFTQYGSLLVLPVQVAASWIPGAVGVVASGAATVVVGAMTEATGTATTATGAAVEVTGTATMVVTGAATGAATTATTTPAVVPLLQVQLRPAMKLLLRRPLRLRRRAMDKPGLCDGVSASLGEMR